MIPMAEQTRRLAAIMFTDLVGYTALMGADENHAVVVVKRSRAVVRESVEVHGGRFTEFEGDGTLSIFPSAVEAVASARELQERLRGDADIQLRVGLHVGDLIESEGHLYGDGVNVTARIRELAPPGGICVSGAVHAEIRNKPGITAGSLGTPTLKNVNRPIEVWLLGEGPSPAQTRRRLWPRSTGLAAASIVALLATVALFAPDIGYRVATAAVFRFGMIGPPPGQEVFSTRSADGTRITWASVGSGPPIVQVSVWMTNIDLGPIVSPDQIELLRERHRLVYYDARGFGLSQRGVEHSHEGRVADLEAVIDAAGIQRAALWAISAGTSVAVSYAARHPDRVSRLVLYGTKLRRIGQTASAGIDEETLRAMVTLMRRQWGRDSPTFRDFFRAIWVPDATELQMRIFDEMARRSGTGADAAAFIESMLPVDVRDEAPRIRTPTLLIHRRDDLVHPYEGALDATSLIPGARLITFPGQNHIFLPGEKDGERSFVETLSFLEQGSADEG